VEETLPEAIPAFLAEPTDRVEAFFVTCADLVKPELSLKKYHTRAF
jgi:hypothetical protein